MLPVGWRTCNLVARRGRSDDKMRRVQAVALARKLLDFCYPGVCAGCETSCEGKSPLCDECLDALHRLESAPTCTVCAMPLAQAGAPCPYCYGKGVPHYERLVRLGIFDDPLKAMIHRLKYHNQWALARFLTRRLWEKQQIRSVLIECDCIVAVPLHALRQIMRGYNQAELLAKGLAQKSGRKLVKPIVRSRNTPSQVRLSSRAKRDENLKDAFGLIQQKCVQGRRVVVVDDVTTSGATLQSVARTLKLAKPASLVAIVVAIADPKHYDFQLI